MTRIDGYEIDIVLREEWSRTASVTTAAMESGAQFSDHRHRNQDTLTIEGIISDDPIGEVAAFRGGDPNLTPSQEAEIVFNAIWEQQEPIEVITARRLYKSMLPTSYSTPEDASTGNGHRFRFTFVHANILDVKRMTVQLAKQDLGHRQPPTKKALRIVWRWGHTPGGPHTVMDPIEVVFFDYKKSAWYYELTPRNRIQYVSKNGNRPTDPDYLKLNAEELKWFTADMRRDAAGAQYNAATEEHAANIDRNLNRLAPWNAPDSMTRGAPIRTDMTNPLSGDSLLEVGPNGTPTVQSRAESAANRLQPLEAPL